MDMNIILIRRYPTGSKKKVKKCAALKYHRNDQGIHDVFKIGYDMGSGTSRCRICPLDNRSIQVTVFFFLVK